MTDTWNTKEWKDKAALFVKDKHCIWCNTKSNLVPHHPRKKGGYTHDEYLSLKGCIPLCGKCNFMESKRYKLCPECKQHYYKPKHKHIKLCWKCFTNTSYGQSIKNYYDLHPEKLKKKRKYIIKA